MTGPPSPEDRALVAAASHALDELMEPARRLAERARDALDDLIDLAPGESLR